MVQEVTSHAQSCMITDLHTHSSNEERRWLGRDGGDRFLPEMGWCDAEKATEQPRGTIMPSIVGIFRHCQMNYCGAAEKRSNTLVRQWCRLRQTPWITFRSIARPFWQGKQADIIQRNKEVCSAMDKSVLNYKECRNRCHLYFGFLLRAPEFYIPESPLSEDENWNSVW